MPTQIVNLSQKISSTQFDPMENSQEAFQPSFRESQVPFVQPLSSIPVDEERSKTPEENEKNNVESQSLSVATMDNHSSQRIPSWQVDKEIEDMMEVIMDLANEEEENSVQKEAENMKEIVNSSASTAENGEKEEEKTEAKEGEKEEVEQVERAEENKEEDEEEYMNWEDDVRLEDTQRNATILYESYQEDPINNAEQYDLVEEENDVQEVENKLQVANHEEEENPIEGQEKDSQEEGRRSEEIIVDKNDQNAISPALNQSNGSLIESFQRPPSSPKKTPVISIVSSEESEESPKKQTKKSSKTLISKKSPAAKSTRSSRRLRPSPTKTRGEPDESVNLQAELEETLSYSLSSLIDNKQLNIGDEITFKKASGYITRDGWIDCTFTDERYSSLTTWFCAIAPPLNVSRRRGKDVQILKEIHRGADNLYSLVENSFNLKKNPIIKSRRTTRRLFKEQSVEPEKEIKEEKVESGEESSDSEESPYFLPPDSSLQSEEMPSSMPPLIELSKGSSVSKPSPSKKQIESPSKSKSKRLQKKRKHPASLIKAEDTQPREEPITSPVKKSKSVQENEPKSSSKPKRKQKESAPVVNLDGEDSNEPKNPTPNVELEDSPQQPLRKPSKSPKKPTQQKLPFGSTDPNSPSKPKSKAKTAPAPIPPVNPDQWITKRTVEFNNLEERIEPPIIVRTKPKVTSINNLASVICGDGPKVPKPVSSPVKNGPKKVKETEVISLVQKEPPTSLDLEWEVKGAKKPRKEVSFEDDVVNIEPKVSSIQVDEEPAMMMEEQVAETMKPKNNNQMLPPPCLKATVNKPGPTILGTGLKASMLEQAKALVGQIGGKLVHSMDETVTHVVAVVDESNRTKRTVKYASAVLRGLWILSFDWILSSFSEGKWSDESLYEVTGDTLAPGAPTKSRKAHEEQGNPKLFDGYSIHCYGEFGGPSSEEIEGLARLGGALSLHLLPKPPKNTSEMDKDKTIVLCDPSSIANDEIEKIYFGSGRYAVHYSWLLDSISKYQIQVVERYQLKPLGSSEEGEEFETQHSLAF
eukprot:TRINITY_DN5484_c0_g1_i1.p1 TRINITY_DN5484_c0_g1~~TRINITY_DN5484_c0_g1_i1.p1  ORF type:complete len:1040 (-),score=406.78 TRINITY_DN5484_c0_g1_i1:62-3181(-)